MKIQSCYYILIKSQVFMMYYKMYKNDENSYERQGDKKYTFMKI